MAPALPRTRSFRRAKPMRLWWVAVGIALLANLGVIVGLGQVSQLHGAPIEPPLAVRSLRQLDRDPPPPEPEAVPQPAQAEQPVMVALPSLDLPSAGPTSALALPAIGSLDANLDLPLTIPAFAGIGATEIVPAGSGLAVGSAQVDTPAEREGAFDLDRFFPRTAKLRGITGSTRIRCTIGVDGRVCAVTVLESTPAGVFDQAAERLARSLRFRPARAANQPIVSQYETVIAWTLK